MTKPQHITVIGRRWFERVNGNTYHSVSVYVDGDLLERVPFTYGYGSQFEQSASDVLANAGLVPKGTYTLSRYFREHNVSYVCEVSDVARKKDL